MLTGNMSDCRDSRREMDGEGRGIISVFSDNFFLFSKEEASAVSGLITSPNYILHLDMWLGGAVENERINLMILRLQRFITQKRGGNLP